LILGIIAVRLPEPVLAALVIGISAGPLITLARRSVRTALLVALFIFIECLLDVMNITLEAIKMYRVL
jgi:hypothetical protein